jgi:AcrR family transcriptional regulator
MMSNRQTEIIQATLNLIAEKGLSAVTMKDIADQFKISDAALYKHFRSKNEILSGVAGLFEQDARRVLDTIDSAGSPLKSVRTFFLDRCDTFARFPALSTILLDNELLTDASFGLQVKTMMEKHQKIILAYLRKGMELGEVRTDISAEHLFLVFMGSLRLLVRKWKFSGYGIDLSQEGRDLWESLEKMVRPL